MTHSYNGPRTVGMVLAICATLLNACGGGGSTADGPGGGGRTNELQLENFVATLAAKGGSFSASRTDASGTAFAIKVVYVPGSSGSLVRRETLVTNGVAGPTTATTISTTRANGTIQITGWTDDKGNSASSIQTTALPLLAKPGQAGNLFTANLSILDNGINTSDIGLTHKLRHDWSIANPTAASADICLSTTETADFVAQTRMDCFKTDTSANATVLGFTYTLTVHAKSVDSTTVYK